LSPALAGGEILSNFLGL